MLKVNVFLIVMKINSTLQIKKHVIVKVDLKEKEVSVSKYAKQIKYGKMINVFVFQDPHGLKVHVDFVLQIPFLMLNKQLVSVKKLTNFTVLFKIYVFYVQVLLTLMELLVLPVKKMLDIMLIHFHANVLMDMNYKEANV